MTSTSKALLAILILVLVFVFGMAIGQGQREISKVGPFSIVEQMPQMSVNGENLYLLTGPQSLMIAGFNKIIAENPDGTIKYVEVVYVFSPTTDWVSAGGHVVK